MTKKDASRDPEEISDLGETILAELGAATSNNTLIRWLAHQAARHIQEADDARSAGAADVAEREETARATILRLWEARTHWPIGWPPAHAVEMANMLNDLPDLNDSAAWKPNTIINNLSNLHFQIVSALVDVATGTSSIDDGGETREIPPTLEADWVERFGESLTEDEVVLLERVAARPARMMRLDSWWKELVEASDSGHGEAEGRDGSSGDVNNDDETPKHPLLELADAYREVVLGLIGPAATKGK